MLYDTNVIPVWLIWDGERFRDGVDIDPSTFYERLKTSDTLPTSSQPSAGEFMTVFQEMAAEADAILNVLVSSKISGTIACAQSAQEQLPDITMRTVDTFSSSMGLGLVVLAAARAVAAGKSLDEVVAVAEDVTSRLHLLFVVDTLEYLHRGGRITGGKRMLGTALQIKPILHFKDGLIQPLSQTRTKRKAIVQMLDIAEQRLGGKNMTEAAIVDVNVPEEGDKVAKMVEDRFSVPLIHRSAVSPVVGTHVGPGAIGFAFYAEP
ncbi:MAG: DegV family protein [Chloroflexota bacterium]|nr:DegV family protein [Chloroflexota bacterium]